MITKEQIVERRAGLLADYHALSGAIQDCDYWLQIMEGAASAAPSDTVTLDESNTDAEVENGTET